MCSGSSDAKQKPPLDKVPMKFDPEVVAQTEVKLFEKLRETLSKDKTQGGSEFLAEVDKKWFSFDSSGSFYAPTKANVLVTRDYTEQDEQCNYGYDDHVLDFYLIPSDQISKCEKLVFDIAQYYGMANPWIVAIFDVWFNQQQNPLDLEDMSDFSEDFGMEEHQVAEYYKAKYGKFDCFKLNKVKTTRPLENITACYLFHDKTLK